MQAKAVYILYNFAVVILFFYIKPCAHKCKITFMRYILQIHSAI